MARTLQPLGKGYYVRGNPRDDLEVIEAIGAQWAAFHASHPDQVAWLRSHGPAARGGLRCYLYQLADGWQPATWRASLARLVTLADELGGIEGLIVDPEDWPLWRAAGVGELRAMKAALLKVAASGLQIVVTSFPTWGFRGELADPAFIGSPQIYLLGETGPSNPDGGAIARTAAHYLGLWTSGAWGDVVPSLAIGTRARAADRTPIEQRTYLEAIPPINGAIFWSQKLAPPADRQLWEIARKWSPRPLVSCPW